MGLSSNILWHQTKKMALQKIIKSKQLLYSYSLEVNSFLDDEGGICTNQNAIPMISVSDLPFAEVWKTLKSYGEYAVGLNKSWGVKNRFTSVWYCDSTSAILNAVMRVLGADASDKQDALIHMLCYVKNYEGPLIRNNKKKCFKNYRYYDEREFRVVPSLNDVDMDGNKFPLNMDQYASYKKLNGSSIFNDKLGIGISYEDIKYILVKNDQEKQEFAEILKNSYGIEFSKMNIQIFTHKQLLEDFVGTSHNRRLG